MVTRSEKTPSKRLLKAITAPGRSGPRSVPTEAEWAARCTTLTEMLDLVAERPNPTESAIGLKQIAFVLDMDVTSVRRALKRDDQLRKVIHEHGGSYRARVDELLFYRSNSPRRAAAAAVKPRAASGKWSK